MAQKAKTMPAAARQARIRELLNERQTVSIPELARTFGVSEMTVRRDLAALARGGQVRRTHGGAMAAEKMVFEFNFRARRQAHRDAKRAIAREAAKLIKPGQTIILDTGTTTLELAALLKDSRDLTVITPSLAVASELQFSPGVRTVLLGGVVRRGSPDLTGAVTEANLEMLAADVAFQGADAIDLEGRMYNGDLQIAHVDEKMRRRAKRTYILCDSSKIGSTALACNGSLRQTEALITDDGIDPRHRRTLEQTGATVVVVPGDTRLNDGRPSGRTGNENEKDLQESRDGNESGRINSQS